MVWGFWPFPLDLDLPLVSISRGLVPFQVRYYFVDGVISVISSVRSMQNAVSRVHLIAHLLSLHASTPILIHRTAHINPAMFFFLAIIDKVSWKECFACGAADFAGAFCGAVLVAIFYYPHFGFSLPLPSDISDAATMLEGPVSMEKNAGRIASAFGPASRQRDGETLRGELRHFFAAPTDEHFLEQQKDLSEDAEMKELLSKMKMRHPRRSEALGYRPLNGNNFSSTRSLEVAALLHEHDPAMLSPPSTAFLRNYDRRNSVQVAGLLHTHDATIKPEETNGHANPKPDEGLEVSVPNVKENEDDKENDDEDKIDIEYQQIQEHERANEAAKAAYKAALQADQSAKLSIFATRPAIFNRPYNFLQEMILSAALILGAELFNLRSEKHEELTGLPVPDGPYFKSFYVAMFIAMLILGLGGVTGLAANPARDLGPRLAHYLLPLPGKGSSEWHYGLIVPLWGPLAGSVLAAAVFKGCEALFDMVEIEEVTEASGVEL